MLTLILVADWLLVFLTVTTLTIQHWRRDKSDALADTRGDLAKNILKLKVQDKATFSSPTNEWCLLAPSVMKPGGSGFVVDSVASVLMSSRKDLNSAEWETARVSEIPTTVVVAANGSVQTKRRSDRICEGIGFIRAHSENSANISRRWFLCGSFSSMSPERSEYVVQPRTLVVMWERVRFIWASNTTRMVMLFSMKSQSCA